MIPTIPYLKQKFDEFNQLIFNNAVARPRIELCRSRSYHGQCTYTRRRRSDGTMECSNFRIRISVSDDRPEHEVEDTLIHEMIHYYIGVKGMQDNAPHGRIFRSHMERINRQYGRHIVVSHRRSANEASLISSAPSANGVSALSVPRYKPRTRSSVRVVAVLTLQDGRYGFKVLPRTVDTIVAYYNRVCRSPIIKSVELYTTLHPYFCRYPRSGAGYYHLISDPNFQNYLVDAIHLHCNGTGIAY